MKKETQKWFIGGLALLLLIFFSGAAGYMLSARHYNSVLSSFRLILKDDPTLTFVRPLSVIVLPSEFGEKRFKNLQKKVIDTVALQPKDTLIRYSFYFKNLNDSYWVGINENDTYSPGSLLKVVVALAVYTQAESDASFLKTRLTYTKALSDVNKAFPFAPPVDLVVGRSYTVPELLKNMLARSDNASKDLLFESIDSRYIDSVFTDLSVKKPDPQDSSNYTISTREYSRFFRSLYYATQLSPKNSNQLLKDLSQASFTQGIVAGVPEGVTVAHKYGEHVRGTNGIPTSVELSDCGIVYHPKNPYFICIMTEGHDEPALTGVIAAISKVAYESADAGY